MELGGWNRGRGGERVVGHTLACALTHPLPSQLRGSSHLAPDELVVAGESVVAAAMGEGEQEAGPLGVRTVQQELQEGGALTQDLRTAGRTQAFDVVG